MMEEIQIIRFKEDKEESTSMHYKTHSGNAGEDSFHTLVNTLVDQGFLKIHK